LLRLPASLQQPQQKDVVSIGARDFKRYQKICHCEERGENSTQRNFTGWSEKFDYKSIVNRERVNVMALQK
jgi:hypothetical protein